MRLIAYAGDAHAKVLEIERQALKVICCLGSTEPTLIRNYLRDDLMTTSSNGERLAELLALTWWEIIKRDKSTVLSPSEQSILWRCVYDNNEPAANDYAIQVLCSESVRSAFISVEKEINMYPWLVDNSHYSNIFITHKKTLESLSKMAWSISNEDISIDTLDLLVSKVFLAHNLTQVQPTFDPTTVQRCQKRVTTIRKDWIDLLAAFRDYMPQHPRFQDCSAIQTTRCKTMMDEMERKPIKQWTVPALGGAGMRELAKTLRQAQNSRIYLWLWQRQCELESNLQVSDSPEDAVIQWKDSIDRCVREWKVSVQDIHDQRFEKSSLLAALNSVLEDEPACPEIPNDQLQARDVAARHVSQIDEHRSGCINIEVDLTFEVLGGLGGVDKQTFAAVLNSFLAAAAFYGQAKHLLEISKILNCVFDDSDPLEQFCKVMNASEGQIQRIIQDFNLIKHRYPIALQIHRQFLAVLIALIKEGGVGRGLLNLFQRFISRALLNQMVARIITEVPPTTHVLLVALQQARDAFELTRNQTDYYTLFCQAKMQSLDILLNYFNSVGWCVSCLRKLTNGIDTIISILDNGLSGTNVVRIVHSLMFRGEFIITLPEAQFSATYMDKDGNVKELNAVELGDIPFQLCLTGSTDNATGDDDNERGIQRDQNHFLAFMELLVAIREVLFKLSSAGHPEYQESKLIIPGTESLLDMQQMLENEKEVLSEWQQFLLSADTNLPLLSCLSRKQLVDSMRLMAKRDDPIALARLLRSVYPVLSESSAKNIVVAFFKQRPPTYAAGGVGYEEDALNASKVSTDVHNLLKKALPSLLPRSVSLTDKIKEVVNAFKIKVPEKLLTVDSSDRSVSVLVLPKQSRLMQSEVSCALYVARFGRLPAVVEIFACSADSSELAVTDFVRRWYSSEKFLRYLPVDQRKMMFCLLNVDQLKPGIQNSIVTKIHSYRRSVSIPLLILAATENEMDSVLCAGLRGDWISSTNTDFFGDCRPLLSEFLEFCEPIRVYSSPYPSSGKSTAILETFVLSNPETNIVGQPYSRIPISGDLEDAVRLLTIVERNRQLGQFESVILHLNISNALDVDKLNLFFLTYVITGVVVDSEGHYSVRNRADTIIIEWPSEGVIATEAAGHCGLVSSFIQEQAVNTIYFHEYVYTPCVIREDDESEDVLYFVNGVEDQELKIGTQMMLAYFNVPQGNFTMPYRDTISSIALPGPKDLFNIVRDKIHFEHCPLPSPGVVYRFLRFFANQLLGLYNFSMYEMCTAEAENLDTIQGLDPESHCRNFRRLVYHFARCSFKLAVQLSAEAVEPLSESYVENDTRLENLTFNFSTWKGHKFLIFSGGSMPAMVSTSGDIFLNEIVEGDNDPVFKRFVKLQHRGTVGLTVQALCCQLSDTTYEPEREQSSDHALQRLFLMLGEEENFAVMIFNELRKLTGPACPPSLSPDQPITNLNAGALRQLRDIISHLYSTDDEGNDDADELSDDNLVGDFSQRARDWFQSICGSYTTSSPPFVLTVDNLVRLLAIKIRLACKIPVVFVGETGSGKTHLVSFYSRISGCLFEIINVHGGMQPVDLLNRILAIIKHAKKRRVIILLDEVNSMPSVWTIKELVCERFIMGRRIPSNVRFICIMNPRRRRLSTIESSGLDFSPYQGNRGVVHVADGEAALAPLVYEVYRSPESIMSLAWDFGNPCDSMITREEASLITHQRTPFPSSWGFVTDELLFAESMAHWLITSPLQEFVTGIEIEGRIATGLYYDFQTCDRAENEGVAHFRFLRSLLCAMLKVSQEFMRTNFQDVSAASLRDIARTISLISFVITAQQRCVELDQASALNVRYLYFRFLEISVQVSFTLNYGLRLGGALRRQYLADLRGVWNLVRAEHNSSISDSFMPVPTDIYGAFDQFAVSLCGSLSLDDGMAINEALKENVTSLFCSIMGNQDTGIAQFIVGRPGSTKSSSLDILCSSTDPNSTDPRCKFFRAENWFEVRKFVLQCTPDTTADDIIRVANSAANYQSINSTCRCVIVLEEVGVTVGSAHNPLMVLHGLVDRGVLMSNGKFIRLPIVGVSNWRLDASKMNRMRTTYRGNPTVSDLMQTAHCIMNRRGAGGIGRFDQNALTRFAQTFSNYVLSDEHSSEDVKRLGWFYGMRDFYAFIQLLQMHHSQPLTREMGLQVSVYRIM